MPRPQDTKSIAKRIDLHYFKRPGPLRWWRRLLIVVLSVGALGWMALAYSQNSEQIYNPGPVSTAHALIEHNCAACHVSDGKGGFSRAVSDNACSACHEGPVHAANQLALNSRQSPGQVVNAGNRLALAVWMATDGAPAAAAKGEAEEKGDGGASPTPADAHHGGTRLTSAQCVACHVEHRGQDALAAVADANCTQCHRNLPDAAQDRAKLQVPARVTAFTLNDHPRFGRRLKGHALATPAATATTAPAATYGAASTQAAAVDSGTETQSGERVDPSEPTPATTNGQALVSATGWVDPTRLKFNHEYHLSKVKALKDNCTACHSTAGPGSSMAPRVEGGPPFPLQDGSTSPWPWRAGDDGRYMQPVNYELHCAGCHNDKLQVPNGGPTLSHRDMSVVRAEINSLPVLYAQMLAKDANREKKLAKVKAGAGTRESRWV